MCATSSSSAGLTCQLSRRFGSGEESSLFAKLPPWQIFHPGFELTEENLTTTVCLAAPHPCRIVLLRLFLLFGSLRWELRQLFARRHLEGISFLYRWSFFCNSISAYSCCQEPEMGQVKGCHNGEGFYPSCLSSWRTADWKVFVIFISRWQSRVRRLISFCLVLIWKQPWLVTWEAETGVWKIKCLSHI